jgi:polysaccharide biosynthesis protein PslG
MKFNFGKTVGLFRTGFAIYIGTLVSFAWGNTGPLKESRLIYDDTFMLNGARTQGSSLKGGPEKNVLGNKALYSGVGLVGFKFVAGTNSTSNPSASTGSLWIQRPASTNESNDFSALLPYPSTNHSLASYSVDLIPVSGVSSSSNRNAGFLFATSSNGNYFSSSRNVRIGISQTPGADDHFLRIQQRGSSSAVITVPSKDLNRFSSTNWNNLRVDVDHQNQVLTVYFNHKIAAVFHPPLPLGDPYVGLHAHLGASGTTNNVRFDNLRYETFPARVVTGLNPIRLETEFTLPTTFSAQNIRFDALLLNGNGTVARKVSKTRTAVPGQTIYQHFQITPPNLGYYPVRVDAVSTNGEVIGSWKTACGVIRPWTAYQEQESAMDSVFGIHMHWAQWENFSTTKPHRKGDVVILLNMLKASGIRWMREVINWNRVEPTKGQYTVPVNPAHISRAALDHYGLRTLHVLCYGSPAYPAGSTAEAEAYGKYAEFTASSLKGHVDHFELWNEPQAFAKRSQEQYVGLLKAGYDGVHAGNPNAKAFGPGGATPGGWSTHYLRTIEQHGALNKLDGITIHPYTHPNTCDLGYGASHPLVNLLNGQHHTANFSQKIQAAQGWSKPPGIWITEMGWATHVNTNWTVSLAGQEQQVARAYALAATVHDDKNNRLYERLFIHHLICSGEDTTSREENFGLLDHDYSVRPSFVAAAAATRAIGGRPFIRRIAHPNPLVHLYLFGPSTDALVVGWITEITPEERKTELLANGSSIGNLKFAGSRSSNHFVDVTVNIGSRKPTLRDSQDRVRTYPVTGETASIRLTCWPKYLDGLDASGL